MERCKSHMRELCAVAPDDPHYEPKCEDEQLNGACEK